MAAHITKTLNMNPWPTKKLGEVCSLDRGTNPIHSSLFSKIKKSNYIRFVQLRDFETDNYVVYIPKNLKITISNKDDSIVALSGATAGKVVMGLEGAINSALLRIRPLDSNILNKSFLHYFLLFSQKSLSRLGRGGAQPNISKRDVAKIKIPIPPLKIQRKIVERLDAIKKAQELNDKQIELAEELFQSLLHRELDPKGKNWEVKKLGELSLVITKGTTPTTYGYRFTDTGIPFLRAEDINNDLVNPKKTEYHISKETHEFMKRSKTEPRDILVTIAGTIGRVAYVPENAPEMNMNQAVAIVRLKPIVNYLYVFYLLQTKALQKAMKFAEVTGTVTNISLTTLKNLKIPLPTFETQQKIVEKLSAIQEYKKKLLDQKQKLQELFESVLNKSFKGEI
jgi:type I restriction enzyme S subunit